MSNRLTIKGQVTIPKNVRDFLGLSLGNSAVEFSIEEDGSVKLTKALAKPRQTPAPTSARVYPGRPVDRCSHILALLSGSVAPANLGTKAA